MITFKQFKKASSALIETKIAPTVLFKFTDDKIADALLAGKSIPTRRKFESFTDSMYTLRSEFGNRIISCTIKDLPNDVKVIPIQYDLAWFTASQERREILEYVTARTEEEWLHEFNHDHEAADDEIQALFGDEHEVLLIGLHAIDPVIFKVLK